MNRKDVLTDFCVYILLLGDEFCNEELFFFDSRDKTEATYKNYVDSIQKIVNVDDFIWDTDINKPISNIKSLSDLITENEIELLQDYIKNEFDFGYPNEINEDGTAFGETYKLNFPIEDIKSYFIEYLDLRKINTSKYITYYQQFLNYLNDLSKNAIEATKIDIDNFYNNKSSIGINIYSELEDLLESELKNNLMKCIKNTSFQLQGGFDKFGFILNYKDTLKTILKQYNLKYSKLNLNIEPIQYFALIEYEYFSFKIKEKKIFTKSEKQKKLQEEFELIKKEKPTQIQFLKNKGFDNREINIILNCFCFNKFNALDIRHIRSITKVGLFNLFYFFYRFEFLKKEYKIKLDLQNDFLKAPLIEKTGSIDLNMYLRYYKHSKDVLLHYQEPHNDFPFKQAKKLLTKINEELYIDLKKLNIPLNEQKSTKTYKKI
ncbi:hypothetical protein [uncultured Tenacibaculum sp.]|uniref:hypothetical protein n=1 Tax=uncultured Tenacibaculum sp. TaxID=174713 RepID=UPI002625A9A3|nr:hypothetical protein [uncultured Tenacibaculum sp.]